MSEFDELKRLAEAATRGNWSQGVGGFPNYVDIDSPPNSICKCFSASNAENDAAYIAAANPATILALIARVEAAEAGLAQEKRRMDFVINSRRVFHGLDETTNNDGIRSTIDELMGE